MRGLIFTILVAVPTSLITWIIFRGMYYQPNNDCPQVVVKKAESKSVAKNPDQILRRIFKKPLGDFKFLEDMALYDDKGLFEYINGAAPIYIERNFRKLAAAELLIGQKGELTCDIYDMQTSKNATSIYEIEKPTSYQSIDLGEAGRTGSMSLVFRQGPYYIKITAFNSEADSQLSVLGKIILKRIKDNIP